LRAAGQDLIFEKCNHKKIAPAAGELYTQKAQFWYNSFHYERNRRNK
jgi:hypothetical protein